MSPGVRVVAAAVLVALQLGLASSADIRLQQDYVPKFYRIIITPDFVNGNFSGFVSIDLVKTSYYPEYSNITLHAKDLTVRRALFKRGQDAITVQGVQTDKENELIAVVLSAPISAGSYTLDIEYEGLLRDDMTGFYRSIYTASDGTKRWLGATQFEAPNARKAFPCFDEPHFRTGFDLTFYLPQEYDVISNAKKSPADGGSSNKAAGFAHNFKNYPSMPTYLLGWIIFERASFVATPVSVVDGVEYRVWSQEAYAGQADYANQLAPRMIGALVNYTGVPYKIDGKLEKMDQIAVPDFDAGAMENWGLVTYRENRLLFDSTVSTTDDLRDIAMVIAHEFTHQWFGDRVTLAWWSYTWLNEAFARFFQYFIAHKVFPTWELDKLFNANALQVALDYDSKPTHPITCDIVAPANISAVFDTITYSKGASVVRMMEHILTPSLFQSGIHKYLDAMSNSVQVATPTDLFGILATVQPAEQRSPVPFDRVMRGWTEQQGHPVINVTRNFTTGEVNITQARFLYEGSSNELWYVPLTFTSWRNFSFYEAPIRAWLTPYVPVLQLNKTHLGELRSTDWLIFNIQQKGFYRVNYDVANWRLLIAQLKKDPSAIHVLNRAQLVDDAFALARAGQLNYTVVLDLISYLNQEEELVPWLAAVRGFDFLLTQFYGKPFYGSLTNYILKLAEPSLKKVGFYEANLEKMPAKLKRILLLSLAARLNHSEAKQHSAALVKDLSADAKTQYSPDVRKALLCSGIRANATVWPKFYQLYNTSGYPTQINDYLRALSCTEDQTNIQTLMDTTVSTKGEVRRQDAAFVFAGLSSTPASASLLLKYVFANYPKIIEYNFKESKIIGKLISGISDKIYTKTDLAEIDTFLKKPEVIAALDKPTQESVNGTIQQVDKKLKWREAAAPDLALWFAEAEKTTVSPPTEAPKSTLPGADVTTAKPGSSAHSSFMAADSFLLIAVTSVVAYALSFTDRSPLF